MAKIIDRFDDKVALTLDVDGFEQLTLDQQHLVYYLTQAGHAGRDLFYLQCCKHSLVVRRTLEAMYQNLEACYHHEFEGFIEYLKVFYANNGLYDDNHNTRAPVTFSPEEFNSLIEETDVSAEDREITFKALFDEKFIKPYRTFKEGEGDLLALSEVNIYEGLTKDEVVKFRDETYSKDKRAPNRGLNTRLAKSINSLDGETIIEEQVMRVDGLYGEYLERVCHYLTKAIQYTENDAQKASLEYLIKFYQTGDVQYFNDHCVAWVQDSDSSVFYINGFIEDYNDPLGCAGFFESLVAFKNPVETKRLQTVIDNIQWFEDNLPCDPAFKKKEASAMSASSITVASFSGQMNPQLSRGVILPNEEWMREEVGAKSVTLANVIKSQKLATAGLSQEFIHKNYWDILEQYGDEIELQHINLHEMVGHALGQLNDGVKNTDLKEFRSVIEEVRADVIAMYYMADPKLVEIGLLAKDTDMQAFATAAWIHYFTNGSGLQLRRIPDGSKALSQTHMRNRQLLALWLLDKAKDCRCIENIKQDGKDYLVINDAVRLRTLIGQVLAETQRIKSEGDYEAAKEIAFKYGTYIDEDKMASVKQRALALDLPSWTVFLSPVITPNEDGTGYTVSQRDDFIDDQMSFSELS